MDKKRWRRTLAFFEPTKWTVSLKGGAEIVIYADSRGEIEGWHVFNLLMAGESLSLFEVARVPVEIVASLQSEIGAPAPPVDEGSSE